MWQSLARLTDTAHIIGACDSEWDSPSEVGGRGKQQQYQPCTAMHMHHNVVRSCGDVVLLIVYYVPCIASGGDI